MKQSDWCNHLLRPDAQIWRLQQTFFHFLLYLPNLKDSHTKIIPLKAPLTIIKTPKESRKIHQAKFTRQSKFNKISSTVLKVKTFHQPKINSYSKKIKFLHNFKILLFEYGFCGVVAFCCKVKSYPHKQQNSAHAPCLPGKYSRTWLCWKDS